MADILRESNFRTSVDTIGDWERTLLGRCNVTLSLEKRRALLLIKQTPGINRRLFEDAARTFGMKLTGIEFPFRPGFFGFSRCGIDRAASPAAYSVLFITAAKPDGEAETEEFEAVIKEIMSTNYIPYFFYQNGGR
jgi:uncharacterized protein YmfQ (DUF2313 family)